MMRSITSSGFLAAWALAASTACASAPCAVDGDGGTWPGDAATGAGDAPVAAPALDAWQPDAWQPDAPARAEVRYFALHPAGIRFVHVDRCPTTNAESLMVRMRVLLTSTLKSYQGATASAGAQHPDFALARQPASARVAPKLPPRP